MTEPPQRNVNKFTVKYLTEILSRLTDTITSLIETNVIQAKRIEAQCKRIEHLENILEQRYRETKRVFDPKKVNEMIGRVYLIWLNAPPGTGFTYEEAEQEFYRMYHYHNANVGQRMRDLRKDGKLWSQEINDKTTFFLTLVKE